MGSSERLEEALGGWLRIPERIELALAGLGEAELDWRAGEPSLSIREIVHHLVESNLIASNILIAALATNGTTFDWSWVYPGAEWMKRLGYDRVPVHPAIETLRALGEHLSNVIRSSPDGSGRSVRLLDAPGAEPYSKTVIEILEQEVGHAQEHLADLERAKAHHRD